MSPRLLEDDGGMSFQLSRALAYPAIPAKHYLILSSQPSITLSCHPSRALARAGIYSQHTESLLPLNLQHVIHRSPMSPRLLEDDGGISFQLGRALAYPAIPTEHYLILSSQPSISESRDLLTAYRIIIAIKSTTRDS